MSDHLLRLVARIAHGDADALGQLYDHFGGDVYRLALALTSSTGAAEQITAEVFLSAWQSPDALVRHRQRLTQHLRHCCYLAVLAWRTDPAWPGAAAREPRCP